MEKYREFEVFDSKQFLWADYPHIKNSNIGSLWEKIVVEGVTYTTCGFVKEIRDGKTFVVGYKATQFFTNDN